MKAQTGVLHSESQKRIEISLESKPARFFNPTLTWFTIQVDNKKNQYSTTYVGPDGGTYYYIPKMFSWRFFWLSLTWIT